MQEIVKSAFERAQKEGESGEFAELLKLIDQHYIDMVNNFQPPSMPAYTWKGWEKEGNGYYDSTYTLKNDQDSRIYATTSGQNDRRVYLYVDNQEITGDELQYWGDMYGLEDHLKKWIAQNPNHYLTKTLAEALNADFFSKIRIFRPFARGTNKIPFDMPAFVHEGERIIPAADNRRLFEILEKPPRDGLEINALLNETKELKNTVRELLSLLIESNESSQSNNATRIIKTIQAAEKSRDWAARARFEFAPVV